MLYEVITNGFTITSEGTANVPTAFVAEFGFGMPVLAACGPGELTAAAGRQGAQRAGEICQREVDVV